MAAECAVKHLTISYIVAYMLSGGGFWHEENEKRRGEITEYIKMKKRPFILMADWNVEPSEISAEWLDYIGGK